MTEIVPFSDGSSPILVVGPDRPVGDDLVIWLSSQTIDREEKKKEDEKKKRSRETRILDQGSTKSRQVDSPAWQVKKTIQHPLSLVDQTEPVSQKLIIVENPGDSPSLVVSKILTFLLILLSLIAVTIGAFGTNWLF